MTGPIAGAIAADAAEWTVCAGTPYEMGRIQGQAIADKVAGCRDALRTLESFQLLRPGWMPYSLFLRTASRRAEKSLSRAVEAGSPAAHARLLGIADGSRVPARELWLVQTLEALLGSVEGVTSSLPLGACSTVCFDESSSPVGEPLIWHNFDYASMIGPYLTVRESRPIDGYRSIEFTAAPLCGAIDGVNEKGLAMTYNYGMSTEPARPNPTISMRISETLAHAATVDEAVEYLQGCVRWGAGLLMVADASGSASSLELTCTRQGVRRPADGQPLLHTNKYHLEQTIECEVGEQVVFDARAPRSLRGERVLDSPKLREARLQDLLAQAGQIDLSGLQTIMSDHGGSESGSLNTICMHSDYLQTSACIQCLPRSRTLRVSFGTACQAAFREYSL